MRCRRTWRVANVFRHDVTVIGSPMITSAWKVTTEKDEANKTFMRLELQTRAAYEVRLGQRRHPGHRRAAGAGPQRATRTRPTTSASSGGWQEFGAGDCDLALDDAFVPDSDRDESLKDLKTFIRVGDSDKLEMPEPAGAGAGRRRVPQAVPRRPGLSARYDGPRASARTPL